MRATRAPLGVLSHVFLGAKEAEKVRLSHLADTIADYQKFMSAVEALFGKLEFEGSFRAQLRTHSQSGAESIVAYAARTTDIWSKAYPAFGTETQLLLAVDHFITGLADITTRDYLLHDCACRSLTWQEVVLIAQACEASRLSLHAPSTFAAAVSTKVDAPALVERTCTHDKITTAPTWQAKSARYEHVNANAHLSRKENSLARASALRSLTPQENYSPFDASGSHSQCSNSENSARAPADQAKSIAKPRAITCFKCNKSGRIASSCNSDARPARKYYAYGGIWHIARVCPTRVAQKAADAISYTSGAVLSTCRSACQLFSKAVIVGVRAADALVDTGSALSMLSNALYAQLLDAPAIQPFSPAAPEVVGVGGASAKIREYVDMPVEVAGVAVRHPLLVVEDLAFPVIIRPDILRAQGAVLTLDESAPVQLRVRVCAGCREQRTASPA